MTDDLNSIINELENTMQRSQILASHANHINRLQTKQIGLFYYSDQLKRDENFVF
jgi:hypothetical protein